MRRAPKRRWLSCIVAAVPTVLAGSTALAEDDSAPVESALVRAMKDELDRSRTLMLPGMARPYFLSYTVQDVDIVQITGEFGSIITNDRQHARQLRIDVRVGSYDFDNTNFRGPSGSFPALLTLDNDYDLLRRQIWLATDQAYKQAIEELEQKRAALAEVTDTPDDLPDFSKSPPVTVVVESDEPNLDPSRYAPIVAKVSEVFWEYPEVQEGLVALSAHVVKRYFVSSESSFTYEPRTLVQLSISCKGQAEDGMPLKNFASFTVPDGEQLPNTEKLIAEAHRVASELKNMRNAELAAPYTGPVLFEGHAAGQIMRRLLASNFSGAPSPKDPHMRDAGMDPLIRRMMGGESEFSAKLGRRVLPRGFRIEDDPELFEFSGVPLVGRYRVDDEGVPARKVVLVENGHLKGFLMSRTPRKNFATSNGHGRAGPIGGVRGRIGNLLIMASQGLAPWPLKKKLLAISDEAGEEYGVVVRLLDEPGITLVHNDGMGGGGGFAFPQALMAYKVTRDGKEVPLRGLSLETLPARALRDIVATGQKQVVHNFVSGGREDEVLGATASGGAFGVPASIVTPSLLFEEVEVSYNAGGQPRRPLIPRPDRN